MAAKSLGGSLPLGDLARLKGAISLAQAEAQLAVAEARYGAAGKRDRGEWAAATFALLAETRRLAAAVRVR